MQPSELASPAANVAQLALQGHGIEALERQGQEQFDASPQRDRRVQERLALLFLGAFVHSVLIPAWIAGVVMLAEWLAYVDWEGFDSALYANIDAVAALIAGQLHLPEVAGNLLQARDAALFAAQRPTLARASVAFIERHIALFPR